MLQNKNLTILLVLILAFTLFLGIACTPQEKPTPRDNNNTSMGDTRMEEDNNNNDNAPNNNDMNNNRTNESTTKAKRMAEMIANENPSVNSATVIFAEEIVYVGIDLKANLSGNEAEVLKKEVAKMVKEQDPDVETVYVTEDADTYTRLQKVARDIENGRPLSGFLEQLQNMFKRVTPSME